MENIWAELVIIFVLILFNGFFAMSEIAIISARKPRLQQKAKKGSAGAKAALELATSPTRFLSSIQVGITTIGVLTGAFGGATIAWQLQSLIINIKPLAPYSESISLVLVVVGISYFTLILGELVPKRLALRDPEQISVVISRPMNFISTVATPFIKLLSFSTDTALHFLRARTSTTPLITQEEITNAIDMGTKAGLVEPDEQRMITRVFEFGDRQAHSIMTPRTEVIWLDTVDSFEENLKSIKETPHSRYPVVREDPDVIVGIINARDLLKFAANPSQMKLERYLHSPLYIPEHMPILKVLELFRRHPLHFAVVIDEYGGFSGIITPIDLLQAIVGELPAEEEPRVPAISKEIDGYWIIDGSLPIQEFKVHFNVSDMPEEQRYGTISGFSMMMLGHVPKTGDRFSWNGYDFQVTEMSNHTVSKLRVHAPVQET
ncbi:MAG: HlyC/CorC family transporter [Fibrobacter sp.]|nr:HlyC/CorC family transporter [Fibrobacter sp.]